jgi:hypothetical protein
MKVNARINVGHLQTIYMIEDDIETIKVEKNVISPLVQTFIKGTDQEKTVIKKMEEHVELVKMFVNNLGKNQITSYKKLKLEYEDERYSIQLQAFHEFDVEVKVINGKTFLFVSNKVQELLTRISGQMIEEWWIGSKKRR